MTMSTDYYFPLERALEKRALSKDECPDHRDNLFDRYKAILSYLRREVYPLIDPGLAALSADSGFYTLHDAKHFDEVVKYAGELTGCRDSTVDKFDLLRAYEIFVLLVAIRIHDAGNMYGRERHERRPYQILQKMGDAVGSDSTEKKYIADIAQAHGGETFDGSKDTIGLLLDQSSYINVDFRPRVLAAIVRFADEICENRTRAANILLTDPDLLKKNEVFHKYASCVSAVRVFPVEPAQSYDHRRPIISDEVSLEFNLEKADCLRKWGKTEAGTLSEVYLIEEIGRRLDKMFRERVYFNKFVRGVCNVVQVKAKVTIWSEVREEGIPYRKEIWSKVLMSEEEGYPSVGEPISRRYGLTGETLIAEISEEEVK